MKTKGLLAIVMALILAIVLSACGNGNNGGKNSTTGNSSKDTKANATETKEPAAPKEKTVVNFWYLWGGVEGEYVEQLIAEYNASQDLYEVKGLSVPDVQKIVVAISSGDGPDVTDNFSNNTASYAEMGMLEPLDDYIAGDNYDVSDFVPAAIDGGRYNGKLYALPINVNFNMLFYNKQLLADAGLSGPPQTADQLLEYAIKMTKVNSDKTIETIGFPEFPVVYYPNNMAFSLGGDFISTDGKTLTPDNSGMVTAIKLMQDYRNTFGLDNVIKFNSSAKYLDATDPFIMGKQALRIDGPWFGNTIKNVLKQDIDYGVAPLPGGGGEVSSSTFFIPSSAKNKNGAWSFLSWLMAKENMTKFNDMFANLPARTSVYDDPSLQDIPDFQAFAQAASNPNLKSFPVFAAQSEYAKVIADEFELAINGKQTAEDAVAAMKNKSSNLLK
jgi:multiple sugar transport system substrate-binding protein